MNAIAPAIVQRASVDASDAPSVATITTAIRSPRRVLFGIYVRQIQYGPVYGGLAAAIGLMVLMEFSAHGLAQRTGNISRTPGHYRIVQQIGADRGPLDSGGVDGFANDRYESTSAPG